MGEFSQLNLGCKRNDITCDMNKRVDCSEDVEALNGNRRVQEQHSLVQMTDIFWGSLELKP